MHCAVMRDKGAIDGVCVVLCGVAGTCEDGRCVVLGCLTEVWKDRVCVAATDVWEDEVHVVLCCVTGVWEDGVCAVLCFVTGVWEDGVCAVLCCVTEVWEDDVVTSPSPAGGKDPNSASDKVAAVCFSVAVFFSWEVHPGSYLQQLLSRCKILSLL